MTNSEPFWENTLGDWEIEEGGETKLESITLT
jgi:hypothetical protein